jgi:acyl-homoserine lactone acylase PvdQ
MNGAERRARMIFHAVNRVVALAVSAYLLMLLGVGIDGVPALGRALVPGHGAWRSPSAKGLSAAAAARPVRFPGAPPRAVIMRAAFVSTAGGLALELGGAVVGWQSGRLHTLRFRSPATVANLGSGPGPAGGNLRTGDAGSGGLTSADGPGWCMVARQFIAAGGTAIADGTYPAGQSDDAASPWYSDLFWDSLTRTYLPTPAADAAAAASPQALGWELQP